METKTAAVNLDSSGLLSRMPSRWVLLTFLCLALVVRGRTMLSNLDSLQKDPDAYRDVAWNIYFEHTLGLWNDATGAVEPTATRPPLYPLLLSAMYFLRFTPDAPGIGLLQVLLGAGTVWLVWRLGLAWRLPPLTSLLAASLVMVDPILLNQSVLAMTETLATLLDGAGAIGPHAGWARQPFALVGVGRHGARVVRALPAGISGVDAGGGCFVSLGWLPARDVSPRRGDDRRCGRGALALGDSQPDGLRSPDHHDHARRLYAAAGKQSRVLRLSAKRTLGQRVGRERIQRAMAHRRAKPEP